MIDPTSDVGEVDPDDAPDCTVCGDPILNSPNHRVVTWIDDENHVQHRDFCSDDCKQTWLDSHDTT